jgi:PncC family amidohydrolase
MNKIPEAVYKVHEIFLKKRITLSVAESCTGGLISHYLTAIPGASAFFKTGVVAYSAESKKKILGVSGNIISAYGMVSRETAAEMAEKVRGLTGADYAISTTGNLGPDVLEGKEKGLVYIAVSSKEQTSSKELRLSGDRESNKEASAISAIMFLIEIISGKGGH